MIRSSKTWMVAIGASLLLMAALSACQLEDLVKVDVPKGVQESIEIEETISVSESEEAWEDWFAWVERESSRFSDAIDEGNQTAAIIRGLTETGIQIGQDAASTLPGGAFIVSGLGLLGGLFIRRPGDAKREQNEKEASYNAGVEKGKEIAQQVADSIGALVDSQQS